MMLKSQGSMNVQLLIQSLDRRVRVATARLRDIPLPILAWM